MIEFKNVSKKYGDIVALNNVNIKIKDKEFVFIVGASGAGKSTLLKLIMREERPTTGEIIVNGFKLARLKSRYVPNLRRTMGIVFQDFRLIPKLNVYDNVAFVMRVLGKKESEIKPAVLSALDMVGLKKKIKSFPSELSGGEQQRVGLARAIANKPSTIIADEPTGNVDPDMSYQIVETLNEINKSGTTVVMVTHAHELVKLFNKRIILMENGTVSQDMSGGLKNVSREEYARSLQESFVIPKFAGIINKGHYNFVNMDMAYTDELLSINTDVLDARSGGPMV